MMWEEVVKVLYRMKCGKAAGVGSIAIEFTKGVTVLLIG